MMKILIIMLVISTTTFIVVKHPLSMGFTLLIQTTLIAMITGMMNHNFWFSYILFMIMIGGMLVLFIYMTSVASNEKFKYSNKLAMFIMMMTTMVMLMSTMIDSLPNFMMSMNTDMFQWSMSSSFNLSLSKYLNIPSNFIMITMIIYLLVTLIAVVKITNITYGPLRQKF